MALKSKKNVNWRTIFWLIPPIVFTVFFIRYSQNLIVLDDYNMVAVPFLRVLEADGFREVIAAMFSQQNEYRFPILATLSLTQYTLFGQIHFNYYPLYGNLALFGMFFLVLHVFSKKHGLKKLLPVAYLMFPLHIYVIVTWANASCQYLPALCYSLLTMYLLMQDNDKQRNWAFLTGFLGAFSFGSGLFGLLFGIAVLLFRKSYRFLVYWGLFVAAIFAIYFTNYSSEGLSNSSLNNLLNNTRNVFVGFMYVWGGWSDITFTSSDFWRHTVPFVAGLLTFGIIAVAAIDAFRKIIRQTPEAKTTALFTFFTLAFLVFTVSVIVIARTGDDPEFTMLVSNHRYYSFIAMAVCYGWFLGKIGVRMRWTLTVGLMLFYTFSVIRLTEAASNRAKDIATDKFNHYRNGLFPDHRYYSDYYLFQKDVDEKMAACGAYTFPATATHQTWNAFDANQLEPATQLPEYEINDNGLHLRQKNAGGKRLNGTYYLLQSADKRYVYYPKRRELNTLNPFVLSDEYEVTINKEDLFAGVYRLIVCTYENNAAKYYQTPVEWNVSHAD